MLKPWMYVHYFESIAVLKQVHSTGWGNAVRAIRKRGVSFSTDHSGCILCEDCLLLGFGDLFACAVCATTVWYAPWPALATQRLVLAGLALEGQAPPETPLLDRSMWSAAFPGRLLLGIRLEPNRLRPNRLRNVQTP